MPTHRIKEIQPLWEARVADYRDLDAASLNDPDSVELCLRQAVIALGASMTRIVRHPYAPQGLSLIGLGEHVRAALHTWPELGQATLDLWTDLEGAEKALESCRHALGAASLKSAFIQAPRLEVSAQKLSSRGRIENLAGE
jgi:S-adenosylmethionine/arginine decarboxylase-like enzyme